MSRFGDHKQRKMKTYAGTFPAMQNQKHQIITRRWTIRANSEIESFCHHSSCLNNTSFVFFSNLSKGLNNTSLANSCDSESNSFHKIESNSDTQSIWDYLMWAKQVSGEMIAKPAILIRTRMLHAKFLFQLNNNRELCWHWMGFDWDTQTQHNLLF